MNQICRAAALLIALTIWPLTGIHLRAQESSDPTLQGTVHLLWADPSDLSMPRYFALVQEANGVTHQLVVDPRDRELLRMLVRENGRQVVARTSASTGSIGDPSTPRPIGPSGIRQLTSIEPTDFSPARATAPAWAVTTRPYAVLLCRFADSATETMPRQRYVDMYGSGTGGVEAYYREVSRGRISLEGTRVFGWYALPKPRAGYVLATGDTPNLELLAEDCIAAADAEVDFSRFGGIAVHLNGSIGCCSIAGGFTVTKDGAARTVPFMWNMAWAKSGTTIHEMGHTFGLPHSGGPYGAVYDSQWDVMSGAQSGLFINADFGRVGSHFMGIYKDRLGLIPDSAKIVLTTGRWSGILEPHSRGTGRYPQLLVLPVASAAGNMSVTIEARERLGADRSIPAEGVLLASVDWQAEIIDADGNGNPNDAGAVWTVGERFVDAARGIVMSVDSLTAGGPAITVERVRSGSAVHPSVARFERSGVTRVFAANDTALRRDSVRVIAPGTWSTTSAALPSWIQLLRRSGTGDGWVVYGIRPVAAPAGRSLATIRLTGSGDLMAPAFTVELGITEATAGDAALLSRVGYRVTTSANGFPQPVDTVRVVLKGAWSSANWTVSGSAGLALTDSTGVSLTSRTLTGPGIIRVRRSPSSTERTLYDSVRVTISGTSSRALLLVDTVEYRAITARVTLGSRRAGITLPVGGTAQVDSVQVQLANPSGVWQAIGRRRDTQLLRSTGMSGDWLIWTRTPLTIGTSVDTITVDSDLAISRMVDTLTVRDAVTRVQLARYGGSRTVVLGRSVTTDSVQVGILGSAPSLLYWSAAASSASIVFHQRSYTADPGTGIAREYLRFSRNMNLLAPGRYIDTIAVNITGAYTAPALFIDTLTVTAPPVVAGDADVNGTVNSADGLTVLRSLVQLPVSPRANIRLGGDANCDGVVSIADAVIILQVEAGIMAARHCVGRLVDGG